MPSCVSSLTLEAKGAQGSPNTTSTTTGGLGGSAIGVLTVTPGDVLYITVGGMNGYNGGGLSGTSPCTTAIGGNGGGASDIRMFGTGLTDRIIVGAGGGGGGGDRIGGCGRGTGGGGGGGYYGGGGGAGYTNTSSVATGGTQSSGGTGGVTQGAGISGSAGGLGFGGSGGGEYSSNQSQTNTALNGGSGGGLTGNNGNTPASLIYVGSSGAGGSSYISPAFTATGTTTGNNTGNGLVTITYTTNGNIVTASATAQSLCNGVTATLSANAGLLSYTWQPGNIQTQSVSVSPSASMMYTVTATNSLGCISTDEISMTVFQGVPVMTITASTTQACLGETVTLSAAGAVSHTWNAGVTDGVPFAPLTTDTYVATGSNACGTSTAAITVTVAPLTIGAISTPTIVCASKSATLSGGGAASYTWSTMQTGPTVIVSPSVATVYSVTGETGNCIGTATVLVNVNPNPTLQVVTTSSSICTGETVTLTVTGGGNYSWTPAGLSGSVAVVSPTAATAYQVSGDNQHGCIASANTVVIVKPSPALYVNATPTAVCAGASVTITATGADIVTLNGTPASSLNVVNPQPGNHYTITGISSSNQCSVDHTLSIPIFETTIQVSPSTTICPGTSVVLSASGGSSYQWQGVPGNSSAVTVTPVSPLIYTVTATTNSNNINCTATGTVFVDLYGAPSVTASSQRSVMCRGESNTLTVTGAQNYTWTPVPAASANDAVVTVSMNAAAFYNYTVTGADQNGCTAQATVSILARSCVGLNEVSDNTRFVVYPNPGKDEIRIAAEEAYEVKVFTNTGQHVRTMGLEKTNNYSFRLSGLPAGTYFIEARSKNNQIKRTLIVMP